MNEDWTYSVLQKIGMALSPPEYMKDCDEDPLIPEDVKVRDIGAPPLQELHAAKFIRMFPADGYFIVTWAGWVASMIALHGEEKGRVIVERLKPPPTTPQEIQEMQSNPIWGTL